MKKGIVAITLIVLLSSLLSFSLLSRGHSWGDDFAAYIMQARSILTGSEQDFVRHSTITAQSSSPIGPVVYPWGFPLLLAPVYAVFGLNPLVLKLPNILFFGTFLIVFYLYLRSRLPRAAAAVLTGVLGFNPSLLQAHNEILSDLPFLFFSMLSIFLIDRYLWSTQRRAGIFVQISIGLAMFFAYFVRVNGIALVATVLALGVLRGWRSLRKIAQELGQNTVVYTTFIVLFILDRILLPSGEGSYSNQFGIFTVERMLDSVRYYALLPVVFFDMLPAPKLLFGMTGILCCVGVFTRLKREIPALVFTATTLVMLMLYPQRQGLRYLYPLLPFFVNLAFSGGRKLLPARDTVQMCYSALWGGLAVVSVITSISVSGLLSGKRPQIDGPFDEISAEMFSYVRENTPADSLIVFFKPRAMRLLTDRDSLMLTECERLGKGGYIVINEAMHGYNQVDPDQVESCNPSLKLKKVFQNRRFTVYEVQT